MPTLLLLRLRLDRRASLPLSLSLSLSLCLYLSLSLSLLCAFPVVDARFSAPLRPVAAAGAAATAIVPQQQQQPQLLTKQQVALPSPFFDGALNVDDQFEDDNELDDRDTDVTLSPMPQSSHEAEPDPSSTSGLEPDPDAEMSVDPDFSPDLDREPTRTPSPTQSGQFVPLQSGRPTQQFTDPPSPSPSPFPLPDIPKEPRLTCFSASARVEVGDGRTLPMDRLEVGHQVTVSTDGKTSPVFFFSHRDRTVTAPFIALHTVSGGVLTVTGTHFVYIQRQTPEGVTSGLRSGRQQTQSGMQVPARDVHIGDALLNVQGNGTWDVVIRIRSDVMLTGLYNPHTVHGDIVVDGFIVSTYTAAVVSPALGHALLAPVRAAVGVVRGMMAVGWMATTWNFDRGLPVDLASRLYQVIKIVRVHLHHYHQDQSSVVSTSLFP